jgi:hypothetical protein
MPRIIEKHQVKQKLDVSSEKLKLFEKWISLEVTDSLSSRKFLESNWRECLKRYEGVPKLQTRDVPIENAPNIQVTIGAIAADTIYAQAIDLIFNTTPFVTVRPKPKGVGNDELVASAKALQVFANHLAASPDVSLRDAAETSILDNVQLGTGLFYVPWVEKYKKTKTGKVLSRGPKIRAIAPEDIIVPGGTRQSIEEMPLFGICVYYTEQELADAARVNNWDISGFKPLGATNWVRSRRETLGRNPEGIQRKGNMYEIILTFCYYDIDGDGIDEDLFVIYNHEGQSIGAYTFNPMDRRPVERMVYQRRSHLFYGLGVLEMMGPFEEKITDIHNYSTLNILLANSRIWAGDGTVPENLRLWPGLVIDGLASTDSLKPLAMADVYNSIWQDQMMVIQLANQRVGINEGVSPQSVPSRTPGITTMSMLQQVNRRFTPAFDSMRLAISGAVMQCLYRYQERLLSGDKIAEATIFQVLGYTEGMRVIDLLANESFDEQVDVELTAASTSVNREADRQNAMMLTNILAQYYQRTLELVTIAANPETPPEVRSIATKIADAAGEVIDRTIRTFDQVRDPETFVVEVEEELNQLEATNGSPQMAMQQLMQGLLGGAGQQKPLELPERTMA